MVEGVLGESERLVGTLPPHAVDGDVGDSDGDGPGLPVQGDAVRIGRCLAIPHAGQSFGHAHAWKEKKWNAGSQ